MDILKQVEDDLRLYRLSFQDKDAALEYFKQTIGIENYKEKLIFFFKKEIILNDTDTYGWNRGYRVILSMESKYNISSEEDYTIYCKSEDIFYNIQYRIGRKQYINTSNYNNIEDAIGNYLKAIRFCIKSMLVGSSNINKSGGQC